MGTTNFDASETISDRKKIRIFFSSSIFFYFSECDFCLEYSFDAENYVLSISDVFKNFQEICKKSALQPKPGLEKQPTIPPPPGYFGQKITMGGGHPGSIWPDS